MLKDLDEEVFQDICHSLKRFKNGPDRGQYLLIILSQVLLAYQEEIIFHVGASYVETFAISLLVAPHQPIHLDIMV